MCNYPEFSDDMWETIDRLPVKVKILSDTAKLPTYGSAKAACCDLYANIHFPANEHHDNDIDSLIIEPHKTIFIGTGLSFEPPKGYCGLIFARSGLSCKKGLAPANKVGVCDEDYTGDYTVALHNHSDEPVVVHHGDRIAQLMFVPYTQADFEVVDSLDETERGDGGFGHTGTK